MEHFFYWMRYFYSHVHRSTLVIPSKCLRKATSQSELRERLKGRQPLPFPLTLATESRLNVKMPPIRDLYLTSHSPALRLPCPQQVRSNPQNPTQRKLTVLKKIALKVSWLILLGLEKAKSNFNLFSLGRPTFSFLWFKKILL